MGPIALREAGAPLRAARAPSSRTRVRDAPGRVEGWRGGPRGCGLVCIPGFPVRARVDPTVTPFPAPSTSNAAGEFLALRSPAHFVPRVMEQFMLETLSSLAAAALCTH